MGLEASGKNQLHCQCSGNLPPGGELRSRFPSSRFLVGRAMCCGSVGGSAPALQEVGVEHLVLREPQEGLPGWFALPRATSIRS